LDDDRTLIEIRERTFLEILDLTLVVIRRHPVPIALAAVAGGVPCWAIMSAMYREMHQDPLQNPVSLFFEFLFWILIAAPWMTSFLTIVLGELNLGHRPAVGRVLGSWLRALPKLVLYQGIVRVLLIITIILVPIIPLRLMFMNEVILLERGRWWKVFSRGSALSRSRAGEYFGQWLAQIAFGAVFAVVFRLGAETLFRVLTETEVTWEEGHWGLGIDPLTQLGMAIAVAFFGVARFFSYIDQRTRLEGWEVNRRLRAVARRLEEAGA
jgi:hypothetical protein